MEIISANLAVSLIAATRSIALNDGYWSFMYSPMSSLTDPPTHNPIVEGIAWFQGAALGSIATTLAIVAVAAIGLLMLSGRLELRRGVTVVLGCFLLFGAGSIGAAITGRKNANVVPTVTGVPVSGNLNDTPRSAASPRNSYDPYAGASVPVRH